MRITLLILLLLFNYSSSYADKPALTLAKTYEGNVDISQYWVSEKLDGVRAYWNGKQLISRQGNIYSAPVWFAQYFPKQALDGELWLARGQFQDLISIVRKKHAIDEEWKKVRYFVFDLPHSEQTFSLRLKALQTLVKQSKSPYLHLLKQYRLADKTALMQTLNQIVDAGGEGLMLHHADALYHVGRNADLLKVKPYYDAEATVISHIEGKGKFTGLLGSLLVEMPNGKRFKIGSGFDLQQRQNPPAIGSVVTYRYHGKTRKGIPRFASFLRVRKNIL
ncbi:MAG: DNA ligase [Methylococcales bacterium]|nr:DNA ligase [Methylococcales bacterium]